MSSKSKHIIQVFDNSITYSKNKKSFEDRKSFAKWNHKVLSRSGFVKADTLYLNRDALHAPLTGDTILILDINRPKDVHKHQHQLINGNICGSSLVFDIFRINKNDSINLYLNWSYATLGYPKRAAFKMAELKINQAIEVKINGKQDFSLSSRRERTFIEKNYIIQYMGSFDKIELCVPQKALVDKYIPSPSKSINLLKMIH